MTEHNTKSSKVTETTVKGNRAKLAAGAKAIRKAEAEEAAAAAAASKKIVKIGSMTLHPVACEFPTLPAKEMKELREDIKANGIKVPILVNKAKDTIIDGRNRYMIGLDLGLPRDDVPMEVFKGKDEEIPGEILSRNVFRRHLNDAQRVALVAKILAPQLEKKAAERMIKGKADPTLKSGEGGEVAEQVARNADVSRYKAEQAIKALKSGQLDAVIERKKTLKQAAKSAPAKPRKAKKEKPFEDLVWVKWDRFLKGFPPPDRRQVKKIIALVFEHCGKQRAEALTMLRRFTAFVFKWPLEKRSEAITAIAGFLSSDGAEP